MTTTRCRGLCTGTDRTALESPARYVARPGQRPIPVCNCCGEPLTQGGPGDFTAAIAQGRIAEGVTPTAATLWLDRVCLYDVVSMAGLKPT